MLGCEYMLLNTKDMTGIPVVTRSGQSIGKVASFDLDDTTGAMARLHVKTGGLVAGLLRNELFVAATSVISMSPERVVIADSAASEQEHSLAERLNPVSTPAPGVFGKA